MINKCLILQKIHIVSIFYLLPHTSVSGSLSLSKLIPWKKSQASFEPLLINISNHKLDLLGHNCDFFRFYCKLEFYFALVLGRRWFMLLVMAALALVGLEAKIAYPANKEESWFFIH